MLEQRFGRSLPAAGDLAPAQADRLAALAGHGSVRAFADRPVPDTLVELVCACAFSAPSKSDLQLRDIVVVRDADRRAALAGLVPGTDWLRDAPVILILCGNAGRLVAMMERAGLPFPNAHADQLVNAVADAAITLGWLQAAANMAGLGGCAVSGIRENVDEVAALLELPPLVVPFAGFALGWPAEEAAITARLPLEVTLHAERFGSGDDPAALAEYDRRREALGQGNWTAKRTAQYSKPKNHAMGAFLKRAGFTLG
nr:nitroreductase family protein [Halovulum dunhuangense]